MPENNQSMYGSIHTHFESRFDTANDLKHMLINFIKSGAKHVAVTEHGVFSSYEDLKDTLSKIRAGVKDKKIPELEGLSPDFEFSIDPGVEGYFDSTNSDSNIEKAHLILIAKDYEGYLSLCKIITEANKNLDSKGNPIITKENLINNVAKGHLFCTSACIAGPFGQLLGLRKYNYEKKITDLQNTLNDLNYDHIIEIDNMKKELQENIKKNKVLKKDEEAAAKLIKKFNNHSKENENALKKSRYEEYTAQMESMLDQFNQNDQAMKELTKKRAGTKKANLDRLKKEFEEFNNKIQTGEIEREVYELSEFMFDTFGEDNFFFEIQNHGLPQEKEIYNNLVKFAIESGHPNNFIASNDIHVGVRKNDPDYEDALKKRNVIKYTRFNNYEPESADDREYTIKTDDELRNELSKIIKDYEYAGEVYKANDIIDNAINNIEKSLSQCHIEFPKENHYPKFCDDEIAEFEKQVRDGVKKKFPNGYPKGKEKEYADRLEYELGVIKQMGYAGYHLIVADYLQYGRLLGYLQTQEEIDNAPLTIKELDDYIVKKEYPRVGYSIGPGRGSGAGSLVCYAMGITDIDPIPYNLLFERFLNVERVSMPDIDSDFAPEIREKVIDYCKARYGADCICQIMTKSYGQTKGNLRLAARYLGAKDFQEKLLSLSANDKKSFIDDLLIKAGSTISNTTKDTNEDELDLSNDDEQIEDTEIEDADYTSGQLKITLDFYMKTYYNAADKLAKDYDAMEKLPPIDSLSGIDKDIARLAEVLDGVFTNYGQHAAGTIISGDPIQSVIPLMYNTKKGNFETQCTMAQAEAKGLLKMDFLGLDNLSIITEISKRPFDEAPNGILQDYTQRDKVLEDPEIFKQIFCTGRTQGIFQFESPGMKAMLKAFQPETFEDIILLVSAYRPGPMDYIPEIVAQKWFNKFNGDYTKYSEKIKELYPFNKSEYESKTKAGLPYFYDEEGNVLKDIIHSIDVQNDTLKSILADTYGCPIYQEQIMQICQKCAGFSLGEADNVRRAMSKKKEELLISYKKAFVYGDDVVNAKGETIHIPGCKYCGMTQEEGEKLFEALLPFAKYGFNKSHATAYALVSMFTAYQKYHNTVDFFKTSLNHVSNITEMPAFFKEMKSFGLLKQSPSLENSKNEFSIADDGKTIVFGLQSVKGFSKQDFIAKKSVEEFIAANPHISLKTIERYAMLGMFERAWAENSNENLKNEINNRHYHLKWIKEVAPTFKKLNDKEDSVLTIEQDIKLLVANQADPKEIAKLSTKLSKEKQSLNDLNKKITEYKYSDDFIPVPENLDQIMENRQWEADMLSVAFNVQSSVDKINYYKDNRNTFNCLDDVSYEDNNKTKKVLTKKIPAIVLSCSKPKKTKAGKVYYDVILMDRNESVITRRFDNPVNRLDGIFEITVNDDTCKWWSCQTERTTDIPITKEYDQFLKNKPKEKFCYKNETKKQVITKGCLDARNPLKIFPIKGVQEITLRSNLSSDEYDYENESYEEHER